MFRALLITGVVLLAGSVGSAEACGRRHYQAYYSDCCYTPCCTTPVVYYTPCCAPAPVVQYTSYVAPCAPTYVQCSPCNVTYYPTWTNDCCYSGRGRRWR
jgi:hypothetical protein